MNRVVTAFSRFFGLFRERPGADDDRSPLIAVVGSITQRNQIPSTTVELGLHAAEEIGAELAQQGCRILVHTSDPEFIEPTIVRGYVGSGAGKRRSILACYPMALQPLFPEQVDHPTLFEFRPAPNPDWERAFYDSLRDADGVLMIGGGQSTRIAGEMALATGAAVLSVAAFGGAAADFWWTLRDRSELELEDLEAMRAAWTDGSAALLVRLLKKGIRGPQKRSPKATEAASQTQERVSQPVERSRTPPRASTSTVASRVPSCPPHALRVFLCHASEDKVAVRRLFQELNAEGFDPWLDEESLLPGDVWDTAIQRALKRSDAVLICLSQAAVAKVGYIHKEIKRALDCADERPDARYLIPVRLDNCEIPDRLAHIHSVNLFEPGMKEKLFATMRTMCPPQPSAG